MTAIAIIKQSRAVHVLTDGAATNADGTLNSAMVKTWPIPHLSAVVAARGSAHFAPLFAVLASGFAKSFDDLKIVASSIAREVSSEYSTLLQRSWQRLQFELVVAGWSESANAPACYFLCNHTLHAETAPPWQLVEIGPICLLPQTAEMEADLAREYPNGLAEDEADPFVDGLRILEIQRRHPFQPSPDGQRMQVGAGVFVQLTTVTKDGIASKIMRRWPDEIGKPLGETPSVGETP